MEIIRNKIARSCGRIKYLRRLEDEHLALKVVFWGENATSR